MPDFGNPIALILFIMNSTFNGISLLSGLYVVIMFSLMALYDRRLVDRLSLRLNVAISGVDMLRAVNMMVYSMHDRDDILCKLNSFSLNWTILMYVFFTCSIAANLQLVFLMEYSFTAWWEYLYWFIPIALATTLSLIPLAMGKYGLDVVGEDGIGTGVCFYKKQHVLENKIIIWMCFIIWTIIATVYCGVVLVLTVRKLRKNSKSIDSSNKSNCVIENQRRKDLEVLITRVSYYLTAPLITQVNCAALMIAAQVYPQIPLGFEFWDTIGSGIPGILNLITFCMDPAFLKGVNTIRCQSKYQAFPHATANFTPTRDDRPQYITNPRKLEIVAKMVRFFAYPFSMTNSNMMVVTDQTNKNDNREATTKVVAEHSSEKVLISQTRSNDPAGVWTYPMNQLHPESPTSSKTRTSGNDDHSGEFLPISMVNSSGSSEGQFHEMDIYAASPFNHGDYVSQGQGQNQPQVPLAPGRRRLSEIAPHGPAESPRQTPLDANHSWRLEDREFIDQVHYEEYLKSL